MRRVEAEIVSVRAEVIVDDIEEHHEPALVRGIDQRLQLIGRAVGTVGRKGQRAVVAPVARAGKIVDRHQLDGGDAEPRQAVEVGLHAGKAAAGPRMQLIQHGLVPRPTLPFGMAPAIGIRIDHEARAVHVFGLRSGCRIRHRLARFETINIGRAGGGLSLDFEPALGLRRHRRRPAVDLEADLVLAGRPKPKARAVVAEIGRSEFHFR